MPTTARPDIDALAKRFPEHELAFRRLYALDPEFRAVCDDHDAVRRALDHWRALEQSGGERVAEYRRLLEELEAEALAFLNVGQSA